MATNEVDDIDTSSILCEELEVLESIYIHELNVERDESGRPTLISLDLHPATGDDLEKRYVTMTLNIYPSHEYPNEPPGIEIKNPRGIAEQEIQRVLNNMHGQAEERKGGPMLYELTEIAKECLTEGNIPHGPCPICLKLFTEGDPFMRTDCYHHFHHYCLAKHIHVSLTKDEELDEAVPPGVGKEDKEDEVVCPVCRFPIDYYDLDLLDQAPDPQHADDNNDNTVTMLQWQQHLSNMAEIYARQKANGGIIDLEEERNKYLVPENFVISLKPTEEDLPVNTVIIPASDPRDIDNKNRGHNHRKNFRSSRNYGHKYDRSHRSHDQNHFQGHRFSQGHHRERKPRSDRVEENFQNRRGHTGQADSRHKRYVDSGNNERHYSDSCKTHSNPKKVSDKAKHNSDKFEDCDKIRSCSSSEEMKGLTDDLTSKCDLNISKSDESGSSNQSTKASSHTAHSTRGNSASGNSGSANSSSANGKKGNSANASSTRGNSGSVNSSSDYSARGNSGSANSSSDYSTRGNSANVNSTRGNSTSGNSASDNRGSDNNACGNTAMSNRASANSASGNTSSGNSARTDSFSCNSASANSISDNSASAICVNGEIGESETFNSPSESKSSMKNFSVNTCASSAEVPGKSSHAQGHHKQVYKPRFYQAKPSSRYKTEPKSSQNPDDKFLQGDSSETVKDFGGSSRRGRGRAHRKFFHDRDPWERNENSPTSSSETKPRPQSRGRGRGYRGQRNPGSEHSGNYYDSRERYNKCTNYSNPARQNIEMVPGDIPTEHRLNPKSSRPHEVSLQAGKTSLKNSNSDYTKRINCEKSTDLNGLCQKPSKPPPGFSQEIVSAKSRVKSYVKPPPGFEQVS